MINCRLKEPSGEQYPQIFEEAQRRAKKNRDLSQESLDAVANHTGKTAKAVEHNSSAPRNTLKPLSKAFSRSKSLFPFFLFHTMHSLSFHTPHACIIFRLTPHFCTFLYFTQMFHVKHLHFFISRHFATFPSKNISQASPRYGFLPRFHGFCIQNRPKFT